MRHLCIGAGIVVVCSLHVGCSPTLSPADGSVIDAVATVGDSNAASPRAQNTSDDTEFPVRVQGTLVERGEFELFQVGGAARGQLWTVTNAGGPLDYSTFLVVLLDANRDLIMRQQVSAGQPLEHVVRSDTDTMFVGVSTAFGRAAGEYHFDVNVRGGYAVPPARGQVVWLNFAGGDDVAVHRRSELSFPRFDGDLLGSAYAGETAALKAAIVSALEEDYSAYNLTVLTSDDGPPPETPHATIHFGGYDNGLLGLADSVDQYNQDSWESAIIYVESFADYAVMELTVDEMGQMLGNVASHELGHLLGLFHTQTPTDVMDTTGTAWDLAGNQMLERARLEETVFPTGYENSPARLSETIGLAPVPKVDTARSLSKERALQKALLRSFVRDELRCGCGTCLHLDE